MQKIKAIVATTHVDSQNMQITRDALEDIALGIKAGKRPMFTHDHDVTLPPHGKVINAEVQARDDGEYQLVTETEIFEKFEGLKFDDGTILYRQESENDTIPFVNSYDDVTSDGYEISFDVVNFENYSDAKMLVNEIRAETSTDFGVSEFGRKAAIPDPQIIIQISQTIVAYLLAKDVIKTIAEKIIDKLGDTFADDIAQFYSFIKTTIIKYAQYAHPEKRPITYIFVLRSQPIIEFVARTTDPNLVLSALVLENLDSAIEHAKHFGNILNATQIQYILNDDGKWEFNYLLTKTGGTIGTEKAFLNRVKKIELMREERNKKTKKKSRKK